MDIQLNVSGMTCGHCKAAVEGALKGVSGVEEVQVDLEGGKAEIQGQHFDVDALIAAVLDEGYEAQVAAAA